MLFGGNLLRQPAFVQLMRDQPGSIRIIGEMDGCDQIMNTTLFMGTYPGLTALMLDKEITVIREFLAKAKVKND